MSVRTRHLQRFRATVDGAGMHTIAHPTGLTIPAPDLCSPTCPRCTMRHLEEVAVAVGEQWPHVGEPWVAALLLVLGPSAAA